MEFIARFTILLSYDGKTKRPKRVPYRLHEPFCTRFAFIGVNCSFQFFFQPCVWPVKEKCKVDKECISVERS